MKLEELIQKRDETANVLIEITGCSRQEAIDKANNYVNRKHMNDHRQNSSDSTIVELYTDYNNLKWVHVKAWDEDFLLSLYDMYDGDKNLFSCDEAMQYADSRGWKLPSKKQWMVIDTLREQIDKIIEDNGGDKLEKCYWSSSVAQRSSFISWFYYCSAYGTIAYDLKCGSYGGRSIVYLS